MPEDLTPSTGDDASSFDEFLARYLAGERARVERSIDLSRFLGARTQQLLQRAGKYALERGQRELDALHVLRILAAEAPAKDAIERVGADPRAIVRATKSAASARRGGSASSPRARRRPTRSRRWARSAAGRT